MADAGQNDPVADAAAKLAELARGMAGEDETESVIRSVVHAAVREVPGADYAGVTIIDRSGAWTPAATDDIVVQIDALQYETEQGPCLEAAARAGVVRSDDLATDPRWPAFAAAATEHGVRSILSFPLFTDASTIGALNLSARTSHAFGPESERIGYLLAAHAAAAIVRTRQSANLITALDNRDVIGQAKGILMERYRITPERAFTLLTAASQHANVKLHEIARHLTETGELVVRDAATRD